MRDLTLKDIAGYLPYGLRVQELHTGKTGFINNLYQLHPDFSNEDIKISYDHSDGNHIWMIKPLLRPLSCLTKEIEVNGEKFVPLDRMHFHNGYTRPLIERMMNPDVNDGNPSLSMITMYLSQWEKLYEWHFDIHGLIQSGLAIDLNTLTEQS